MENKDQWLNLAIELQGLAQAGLTYGKDVFDLERYTRIREIAAEILSMKSEIPVETVKKLFCNETGYQTPKLDTRAAIIENDRILLVREQNGKWSLPGGWVDVDKSVGENAVKEVLEEAGLRVTADRIIAVQDRNRHNLPRYAYNICKIFFLCTRTGGEFQANAETTESRWYAEMNCRSLRRKRTTQSKFKCALQLPAIQTGTFFLLKKRLYKSFSLHSRFYIVFLTNTF